MVNTNIGSDLKSKLNNNYKLLLFDLQIDGHHTSYIKYLLQYWLEFQLTDELIILVSPKFISTHDDIINSSKGINNIYFIPISEEEFTNWNHTKKLLAKAWKEWKILYKYAEALQVNHVLLMQLDCLQIPLALSNKFPCFISGIYFRPSFHYKYFQKYLPQKIDIFRKLRQLLILHMITNKKHVINIFSLDPFAVKHIQNLSQNIKAVYLPDPIQILDDIPQSSIVKIKQDSLNIEIGRKVFLLFGKIDERKGIYQLIEAINIIPDYICKKICLLVVGDVADEEQEKFNCLIKNTSQLRPIQIISINKFISDIEIPIYFQMSDIILAVYQQHVGMSGIVLHAAAAQKPVLSSDYGLMGYLVHKNKLGVTVDSTSPKAIADEIIRFINGNSERDYDINTMSSFVKQHSQDKFVGTIMSNILNNYEVNN
jgi:glycosyltransferase involved in cell wall biosynthesis